MGMRVWRGLSTERVYASDGEAANINLGREFDGSSERGFRVSVQENQGERRPRKRSKEKADSSVFAPLNDGREKTSVEEKAAHIKSLCGNIEKCDFHSFFGMQFCCNARTTALYEKYKLWKSRLAHRF